MANEANKRRRWFGAISLGIALLMVIGGETVLHNQLRDVAFILYWTVCFVFTMLAIVVAFLDVSALQRRARDQQRELIENTLKEVLRQKELKSGKARDDAE